MQATPVPRLAGAAAVAFAMAFAGLTVPAPALRSAILLNLTQSAPVGLYRRVSGAAGRGTLVAFAPPAAVRQVNGGAVAHYALLLKPIRAGPGDCVRETAAGLWINGAWVGAVAQRDRTGRALPYWRGARRLGEGEYFAVSTRVWNSLDSRYFGPVRQSQIVGAYAPLWTLGAKP